MIVCAHNERRTLEELLPRLLDQRFAPYEVVVADDRSTDGTAEFFSDPDNAPLASGRSDRGVSRARSAEEVRADPGDRGGALRPPAAY